MTNTTRYAINPMSSSSRIFENRHRQPTNGSCSTVANTPRGPPRVPYLWEPRRTDSHVWGNHPSIGTSITVFRAQLLVFRVLGVVVELGERVGAKSCDGVGGRVTDRIWGLCVSSEKKDVSSSKTLFVVSWKTKTLFLQIPLLTRHVPFHPSSTPGHMARI